MGQDADYYADQDIEKMGKEDQIAQNEEYAKYIHRIAEEAWDWGYTAALESGKRPSKSGLFIRSRAASIKAAIAYAKSHMADKAPHAE